MRLKKKQLAVFSILISALFFLRQILWLSPLETSHVLDEPSSYKDLRNLIVFINQFEIFDNDLVDTVKSVLAACENKCSVYIISDDFIYPPIKLPKGASILLSQSSMLQPAGNMNVLLASSSFVLMLPDSGRISSTNQLKEYINLLESGDSAVVALGVGGNLLNCHKYNLDLKIWTLIVSSMPESEACDGVSGKSAFLMRTEDFLKLTHPFAKPTPVALGMQITARQWKIHIGKGIVLGEGRRLYASDEMQWKFQSLQKERLDHLYHSFGVKKVVSSNGKVEWYGCTKNSHRCFPTVYEETPSYLFQGKWTPPCCLEGLRITARHVFQVLRSCHVRWWLEGGSLLGAVRNGDVIPWDYRVDIGFYEHDMDKCPQLKSARWQTLEDSDGYVWQKDSTEHFYQVQYSTANNLEVNLYPFQSRHGQMIRSGNIEYRHKHDMDFPEHFLRPLSSISFIGVIAAAPNNVRDFLELKFGLGAVETPQYPNPEILTYHNVSAPSIEFSHSYQQSVV